MATEVMRRYTLSLSEDERRILLDVLEETLKATRVELHRTESFGAREVMNTREAVLESLLRKAREAALASTEG